MSHSTSLLLAGSLFLALLAVPLSHAGSQDNPEITDPEHDLSLVGKAPGCVDPGQPLPVVCTGDVGDMVFGAGLGGDIISAWIDHENDTSFQVNIQTHDDPSAFMQDPAGASSVIGAIRLTASMKVNGTAKDAIATYDKADGVPTVGGVALSVSHDGRLTSLVVPRSAFGNITAGTSLTNFTVLGESLGAGPGAPSNPNAPSPNEAATIFTDRAPDKGFGTLYNFTLSSHVGGNGGNLNGAPGCTYRSGETNRTDADGDCLPDWWEIKYFGSTTAQDGNGDPDGDGCNNRCEYLHGTDPTKKDTDGDGYSDGDEIAAGTSPTNPASHPEASGTGTTTSPAGSGGSTTTAPGPGSTTSRSSTTTGGSSSTTGSSALDKIQADAGYAVASGAAMGAVVLLSLIGLFGRWGA